MTGWTERYAIVVSNGVLKNSSDVFYILDPDMGGASTFTVPLNATGNPNDEITDWACYTQLQPETRDALLFMSTTEFKAYVDELAVERGREPVGSVTAFKNDARFSEEGGDFWNFIASLGLQVAREVG